MQIKECYVLMEADYEDVLDRMINDQMIYKFNKKFAENTDYQKLVDSLQKNDYETAFRMAHNLKGMCLNLGYRKLFEASNILCEELRNGDPKSDLKSELASVTETYRKVMEIIDMMDDPS